MKKLKNSTKLCHISHQPTGAQPVELKIPLKSEQITNNLHIQKIEKNKGF